MPRLIDADNVEFALTAIRDRESGVPLVLAEWLAGVVSNAPTIDAVPVVRCKNCKHFNMRYMECDNPDVATDNEGGADFSINFGLDDFCSYGERKEE